MMQCTLTQIAMGDRVRGVARAGASRSTGGSALGA